MLDGVGDFFGSCLHPRGHRRLDIGGETLEVEGLSRADAEGREFGADGFLFRSGRGELQGEVEILEEVGLHECLVDLREVDRRRGGRRGLLEVGRERLHLVAGLDLDHVRHVGRVEKLRAIARN